LHKPPLWDALVQVSDYVAPLSGLVMRLKFANQPELAMPLARLLLLRWLSRFRAGQVIRPDVVLSVPLHRRRYFSRGYNQSEQLAAPLAHWLECQYRPHALRRIRATPAQQHLSESARKRNLRRAFMCTESFRGKHVALLDDVVTTGSTLCEISKLLRNQGIASLQIWCVCRTL
jgi:ComF family protein